MNKYNLDEQFMKLSTKQISNMIEKRISKESALSNEVSKLELKQSNCYSDDSYDKFQEKINKLQLKIDDISDWMSAANPLFSSALWSELVDHNQIWTCE